VVPAQLGRFPFRGHAPHIIVIDGALDAGERRLRNGDAVRDADGLFSFSSERRDVISSKALK
jgi:hypothetical protein